MLDTKVNNNFDLYRKIILDDDGVVICPTDTVYGFFASSLSDIATQKIFKIKKRDLSKKLIVNVASVDILKKYVYINDTENLLIDAFWPGQLSIIFDISDFGYKNISRFVIGGEESICVRIPNYPQTLDLLYSVNIPLISTSVNLSGNNPINCYSDIVTQFKNDVNLILPNESNNFQKAIPSTIIDARNKSNIKILRSGAVSKHDIEQVLNQQVHLVE